MAQTKIVSGYPALMVEGDKKSLVITDLHFCSCPGYYFNNKCYHLDLFPIAKTKNQIELTTFSDDEYESFINGLLSEL